MPTEPSSGAAVHPSGYRETTPVELQLALGDVRVVDVREPSEFAGELGHIPGAELVPLGTLPVAAQGWDRDAPLVMVCRSGKRSGQAAAALVGLGFRRVLNLRGGMLAYNAAGLPVERAQR